MECLAIWIHSWFMDVYVRVFIESYLNLAWRVRCLRRWAMCYRIGAIILIDLVSGSGDMCWPWTGLPGEDRWRRSFAVLWSCCRDIARVSWSQFVVFTSWYAWRAMSDETTCQKYLCICARLCHLSSPNTNMILRVITGLASKHLLCDSWGCASCDVLLSGEWLEVFRSFFCGFSISICQNDSKCTCTWQIPSTNLHSFSVRRLLLRVCEETVWKKHTRPLSYWSCWHICNVRTIIVIVTSSCFSILEVGEI